jgi:hypothetical protein
MTRRVLKLMAVRVGVRGVSKKLSVFLNIPAFGEVYIDTPPQFE